MSNKHTLIKTEIPYQTSSFHIEERTYERESGPTYTQSIIVKAPFIQVVALTKNHEVLFINYTSSNKNPKKLELPRMSIFANPESEKVIEKKARRLLIEDAGYKASQIELAHKKVEKVPYCMPRIERTIYTFISWDIEHVGRDESAEHNIGSSVIGISIDECENMIKNNDFLNEVLTILKKVLELLRTRTVKTASST